MTFFFPFFLEDDSSTSLESNFLFKEDLRGDITILFYLTKEGGSLVSIAKEEEELDSFTI